MATRTVSPETRTVSTGRRRRRLEGCLLASAGGTLLAFALQVEHRVVDADGEPDQEDDRADAFTHRQRLAEDRHETHRRENGREAQQERDARCDERAEGDQEDAQRQGDGVEPGLLEVVEERSLDLLPGALAERSDVEPGVRLLNLADGGDDRVDVVGGLVGGTGDLDGDQNRVLVTGDQAGSPPGSKGDSTFATSGRAETSSTTDWTTTWNSGEDAVSPLWTRMLSPAGCLNSS